MTHPYRILDRKRAGEALTEEEIREVVRGASGGGWDDAQLAAFLMAAAIRGLDARETEVLTRAMLESGEQWRLSDEVPLLGDKHSTGGVGDKVSLVLAPLLAACGLPVVMLTGRALGHTGGTADKLEVIPGLDLDLDRRACLELLDRVGMAIGVATQAIAPADRRLYRLRDRTATVASLPLITASILSKKLATGASAVVFDVKTGNGAFLEDGDLARDLASMLVETSRRLGVEAGALLTDMSQPLGRWVGHGMELAEAVGCLKGEGPDDLREVTLGLALELARLTDHRLTRAELEGALGDGRAYRAMERWVEAQGGDPAWLSREKLTPAPAEVIVTAPRAGVLAAVDTKRLGLLMAVACVDDGESRIDPAVAFRSEVRLGDEVSAGQALARLYLRRGSERLQSELAACFSIADTGEAPQLVVDRI